MTDRPISTTAPCPCCDGGWRWGRRRGEDDTREPCPECDATGRMPEARAAEIKAAEVAFYGREEERRQRAFAWASRGWVYAEAMG